MNFRVLAALLALNIAPLYSARANEFEHAHFQYRAPAVDSPNFRKYAPDRDVDVQHLLIDVTPDFENRTVTGQVTITYKPINKPLRELRLDAVEIKATEVAGSEAVQGWNNNDKEIIVTFKDEVPVGKESKLTIKYSAEPKKGLYFRTAGMGYKDTHLFTQGEDTEARHWYPSYDYPNEKFTSEVICHVPKAMTVLSNGKLLSEKDEPNDFKAVHWLQDKPHVNYLISLVAGNLAKIEDKYKDIPLAFYTPASQIGTAEGSFKETKEMMEYFEKEIGVPYPWDKYYQVCVNDFMWGGMENTSVTTLTDSTLFAPESENIQSSQGLVAHELAHQWFGDFVTTKDWSHIWLNEGFATYYEKLFRNHKNGRDGFLYELYKSARPWVNLNSTQDSTPIVFREYDTPLELFGYRIYPKGSWVLHMLRSELGEETYRKAVKNYLVRHAFGNVTTPDLAQAFEEASGRSLDQFFDQWVYHPHHPELQATYNWDEKAKSVRLTIKQVQQLTNGIALFRFLLKIRFKGDFGSIDKDIQFKEKEEEIIVALPQAPKIVRIDPETALLAKITFELPRNMLLAQLKDDKDMIGRLIAIEQLSKARDQEAVSALKERLNSDPYYGVRIDAAQALRTIHTPEVLKALLESQDQKDARVRHQVAIGISTFYDPAVRETALKMVSSEKNPDILYYGITSLGAFSSAETSEILRKQLQSTSFENKLAEAAVSAMRGHNNPQYVPALLEKLKTGQGDFTSGAYGRALDTLAYLARNEEKKSDIREFLLEQTQSKKQSIKVAAINALGTLQDAQAIAPLEKFAAGSKDLPETAAADKAVTALRAGRKAVDEFQSIRTEVLDLKKENQTLKKDLEDLKKSVQALKASPATVSPEKSEKSDAKSKPAKPSVKRGK